MYPEVGFETSFPSHVFEIHLISQMYLGTILIFHGYQQLLMHTFKCTSRPS